MGFNQADDKWYKQRQNMERTSRELDQIIKLRLECSQIAHKYYKMIPEKDGLEFFILDENNSGACLPIVLGRVLGKQVQKEDRQMKESIEQMKKGKSYSVPIENPGVRVKNPEMKMDSFSLFIPNKWTDEIKRPLTPDEAYEVERFSYPDKDNIKREPIDFIYGTDPITGEGEMGARIILRTEKQIRWKKGDCLYGPNGIEFKVVDIGWWTWLHRILSTSKYYNAKLTLIAEK